MGSLTPLACFSFSFLIASLSFFLSNPSLSIPLLFAAFNDLDLERLESSESDCEVPDESDESFLLASKVEEMNV